MLSVANVAAGRQQVTFTGRVASKTLKAGCHRLAAVPTDAARNKGVRRTTLFTILRG